MQQSSASSNNSSRQLPFGPKTLVLGATALDRLWPDAPLQSRNRPRRSRWPARVQGRAGPSNQSRYPRSLPCECFTGAGLQVVAQLRGPATLHGSPQIRPRARRSSFRVGRPGPRAARDPLECGDHGGYTEPAHRLALACLTPTFRQADRWTSALTRRDAAPLSASTCSTRCRAVRLRAVSLRCSARTRSSSFARTFAASSNCSKPARCPQRVARHTARAVFTATPSRFSSARRPTCLTRKSRRLTGRSA